MLQVWFLFKGLEALIGCTCIIYHIVGFLNKEPLPHIMLFCGTSFGFTLLASMTMTAIAVGGAPPVFVECIINFTASVMYIITSIVSMYYAENDFHLMYLSDFEEPLHPYFAFCRSQSVAALAAGTVHMLHAILATDALIIRKSPSDALDESSSESDEENETADAKRPIRMYFLSKYVEKKLRRNSWFDKLCQRKSPTLSLFSFTRSRESKLMATTRFTSDENDRLSAAKSTTRMKSQGSKKSKKVATAPPPPTHNRGVDSDTEDEKILRHQDYRSSSLNALNEKSKDSKNASFISEQSPLGGKGSMRFALPSSQDSGSDAYQAFKKEKKTDPHHSILRKPDKQSASSPSNQSSISTQETNSPKSKLKNEEEGTKNDQTSDLQAEKLEPSSMTEQNKSNDNVEQTEDPDNEPIATTSQNETPTGSNGSDSKKESKDEPPPPKPSSD